MGTLVVATVATAAAAVDVANAADAAASPRAAELTGDEVRHPHAE